MKMSNQGQPGQLALSIQGKIDGDNKEKLDNPKNVNNLRNPNKGGNLNNQRVPPDVPIIKIRHVLKVAVPLTTNFIFDIRKPSHA